jgi:hypothetical protein
MESWNRFVATSELLLDTGALSTLLDRSQRNHASFVGFFEEWTGPVVPSEAVPSSPKRLTC